MGRIGFVGLTEAFDESLLMLGQWLGEPRFRPEYRPVNQLAVRECHARQRAAYVGGLAADVATMRERNQNLAWWTEPLSSRLLRNWVYKPALVLRLA